MIINMFIIYNIEIYLCNLLVKLSFTQKQFVDSISLVRGCLSKILCVALPMARDCNALTKSLSGISVSP